MNAMGLSEETGGPLSTVDRAPRTRRADPSCENANLGGSTSGSKTETESKEVTDTKRFWEREICKFVNLQICKPYPRTPELQNL